MKNLSKRGKGMRRFVLGFSLVLIAGMVCFNSCGGNKNESKESAEVNETSFYETQPVHSGLYDADYFDITGINPRKGAFDGRIFFSLSPEMSAIYVFENGNRTKIDNTITLKQPFVKGEDGIYTSLDSKDRSVSVKSDSAKLILSYEYSGDTLNITFNPKARYEGSAVEILEKITAQKKKESGK